MSNSRSSCPRYRHTYGYVHFFLCVSGAWLFASLGFAQENYEGDWIAGPSRMQVTVQSWGNDCGRRPTSISTGGGARVRITQHGDQLRFHSNPQKQTDGCWSDNPAVRRVSTSASLGTWRTICRTPENDPKAETGTYTLRAVNQERLDFQDVSQYDWQLRASRCVARIATTQTFTRVKQAEAPVAPTPSTAPKPCTPGAPSKLSIEPTTANTQPGQTVCFRAKATDAHNCAIASPAVQWELKKPEGLHAVLKNNCLRPGDSAAESEGTYIVRAVLNNLQAQARVNVKVADLSDLIARRIDFGNEPIAHKTEGLNLKAHSEVAARTESHTSSPWIWISLGALLLTIGGTWMWASKNKSQKKGEPDRPVDTPPARVSKPQAATAPTHQAHTLICPTCRRGYAEGTASCALDGTPLISYAEFTSQPRPLEGSTNTSKECPQCGSKYPASERFCGKDGAELRSIA